MTEPSDSLQDQPVMPTPEQLQEQVELAAEVMFSQTVGLLHLFAPHLEAEAALQIARVCVDEQLGPISQQILPTMVDPGFVQRYPTILVRVGKPGDNEIKADCITPKRFDHITDPGVATSTAFVAALLTSPGARALLRAWGFQYHFMQSSQESKGRIIL